MTFVRVSQAQVPSGKAAQRTIRKRSHSLASVRSAVSAGDDTTQLAHEVHSCHQEERKKLIEEIRRTEGGFRISVEQSVTLKADLSIPWSKLRTMRR
jgi:cystathionine beta-lyase/cystathionine gamma-synthase